MGTLLSSLINQPLHGDDILLSGMSLDSREIQAGDLFCAIKGHKLDGHQFISNAIDNGAAAILMQDVPAEGLSVTYAVDVDLADNLSNIAEALYGRPTHHLYVAGVTGTNGKSSVCSYASQLLSLLEKQSAEIGTLGIRYQSSDSRWHMAETANTTPDTITLQKSFAEMINAGVVSVSMEVSSHALDQGRSNGVEFNAAVFTNLSHDHLDYHGTLEAYADAKLKLFSGSNLQVAIVNADDVFSKKIPEILNPHCAYLRYSLIDSTADYYFDDIVISSTGIKAILCVLDKRYVCEFALLGRFNCQNILAAIAIVHQQGVSVKDIVAVLPMLKPVSGRMQIVKNDLTITAVVDYAHTPDALENVLAVLRETTPGKIHLVFGCGGDRDQEKRALMGCIAERLADEIIITTDNPRLEEIDVINADILSGLNTKKAVIIVDRAEAIQTAVNQAVENDVVLIAGKGHEKYQLIKNEKYAFDDAEQLSAALRDTANKVGAASC